MNTASPIRGLILKDLYNTRRSAKVLLVILLVYGGISLTSRDLSATVGLTTMYSLLLPISAFSFDQASHWSSFALTLPITRRQLVTARYAFSILMVLCASFFLLLSTLIAHLIDSADMLDGLLAFLFSISVVLIILSITIPSVYHFGPDRGRMIMFGVCMTPILLIVAGSKLLPAEVFSSIRGWFLSQKFLGILGLDTAIWVGAVLFLCLGLLCMMISRSISCKIVERQEF